MGSTTIDIGPVNVRGPIKARYARVVWTDGTLYVLSRRAGRIVRETIATSEPSIPDTPQGYYRAITDDGKSISFTRRGCGG